MKHIAIAFLAVMFAACASTDSTSDHGYIASIPSDRPAQDTFRVNINRIDDRLQTTGPNHRAAVGERSVDVSLIFNPDWGQSMQYTRTQTYSQTMTIDIEPGVTYYIGARVDTRASREAQRDGSFWEPYIVEQR